MHEDLAQVFRAESARVIAALMHQCRDLSTVEDALQDAVVQACEQWPVVGRPRNCAAWLHAVAKRRLVDRLRQRRVRQSPEHLRACAEHIVWGDDRPDMTLALPDDRLRLIFTCCHPALSQDAQIALTLKVVCGFRSKEIARAFLICEETLNRRLSRAKQKIAKSGIAYVVPEGAALTRRLPGVLSVIYLLFNEFLHVDHSDGLSRDALVTECLRLAKLLFELLPCGEVGGLLALMELHWARSVSRCSEDQTYIPLQAQDRSRWDHAAIARSCAFLFELMRRSEVGPYQLQAAISALHARAESFETTDWRQISGLYAALYRCQPSAVVRLNWCVAQSFLHPAHSVWAHLMSLGDALEPYQPYHAACADVARRSGDVRAAKRFYRRALDLCVSPAERHFLRQRLQALPG